MAGIEYPFMGLWDSRKLAELAREDFERAWRESAELAQGGSLPELGGRGRAHPVFELIQKLREAYLELGFEEVVNPIFIEEKEVRRQFGTEGMAVLDRCFYLGGLPRPNVGIDAERAEKLRSSGVDAEKLRRVLHEYKKGRFTGDELAHRVAEAASLSTGEALRLLREHFPELERLAPEAGSLTLRSHMTSGWFLTLQALYGKRRLPLKLFSVDRCFRREQREDATHLRSYHSASCVVMGEVSLETGREVASAVLERLGFREFRFLPDEKQSKYYAPSTQTEVYAKHPERGWVEVATFGMYSPAVLSLYGIEVPVMNLGMGVERLAMLLAGVRDVRELVYPQFYAEWRLSDAEIAEMLTLVEVPESPEGRELGRAIARAVEEHGNAKAPCRVLAYEGRIGGRHARVWLVEEEAGKRLAGPAALNVVAVHEGSVIAFPPGEVRGVPRVSCAEAVGMRFAARVERAALAGESHLRDRVGMAKSLGDINLELDPVARNYITSREKKIKVGGPVFLSMVAELV